MDIVNVIAYMIDPIILTVIPVIDFISIMYK